MGWNLRHSATLSPLTMNLPIELRFYFVHSYCVHVDNKNEGILKCHYSIDFDAAVQNGNIFGTQFHPEKSYKFGKRLLENFARI